MKKIILLFIVALLYFWLSKAKTPEIPASKNSIPTSITIAAPQKKIDTIYYSMFTPYWTINNFDGTAHAPEHTLSITEESNGTIYFGIAPNEAGIDTTDPGFTNLDTYINATQNSSDKTLALRLIRNDLTEKILQNDTLQDKIIAQSITIATKNNFNELLLDLELSTLPTENTTTRITGFIKKITVASHTNNIRLSVALYGDTFYRARPYDVQKIAEIADQIYVLAYDFHKTLGEPGPNYPLSGQNIYGYDYKTMIDDFLSVSSPEKITIVYGMYGYDWTVDDKNRPLKRAIPLSLNEIKNQFLSGCQFKNCLIQRDPIATETNITYRDRDNKQHSVWYEDEHSVQQKINYAISKQINHVSFWANRYY